MQRHFTPLLLVVLLLVCGAWIACGGGSILSGIDGDGAVDSVDCAPENGAIYPAATELCADEVDNDCDG